MIRDTGSPRIDAENDFLRARRQQVMSRIGRRFRPDGHEGAAPISYDEAIAALGKRGERNLGTLVIPVDRIVGSVDKVRDFDRSFRPTTNLSRVRWERIAEACRRGESLPPIEVYKLGEMYFISDGHHRVSVLRALGIDLVEARVTEVVTALSPEGVGGSGDLDTKRWRRILVERVPLKGQDRADLRVTDPSDYGRLAEMVEAWSARRMYAEGAYHDKETMARRWHDEEFVPVLAMIEDADLRSSRETPADAYLRIACERYEITREHAWDIDVMNAIRKGRKSKRA